MAKFIALVLGIFILNAQCAVYRNADAQIHRVARSPHYGYTNFGIGFPPPPPLPPPLLYHTHNWSGVARGAGGRAHGVFSGAAASAESVFPGRNEAVSLATADALGGQSENCDDDSTSKGFSQSSQYNSKSTRFSGNSFGDGSASSGQVSSFGSGSTGSQSNHYNAGSSSLATANSGSSDFGVPSAQNYNGLQQQNADIKSFGSGSSQSEHYNSGSSGFASNSAAAGSGSSGFGSQSSQSNKDAVSNIQQQNNGFDTQASEIDKGLIGNSGKFESGQNYREAHFSSQSNANQAGATGNNPSSLNVGFGGNEQQTNSKEFSTSQAQSSSFGSGGVLGSGTVHGSAYQKFGAESNVNGQAKSGSQEFFAGNHGNLHGSGYGHHGFGGSNYHGGSEQLKQLQSANAGAESAGFSGGFKSHGLAAAGSASSREDIQSSLNGAIDLASQGLQATDKTGCSTCQKGGFALSNAKSWNGNAISLAIGG